ncbi:hypothetical protein KP509_1Z128000 [Ceratopteris richardii]|nr:hypothetical protein KP509_1Z128000 [Ceratopteris richardii]
MRNQYSTFIKETMWKLSQKTRRIFEHAKTTIYTIIHSHFHRLSLLQRLLYKRAAEKNDGSNLNLHSFFIPASHSGGIKKKRTKSNCQITNVLLLIHTEHS